MDEEIASLELSLEEEDKCEDDTIGDYKGVACS
jgi:hypothetical protein